MDITDFKYLNKLADAAAAKAKFFDLSDSLTDRIEYERLAGAARSLANAILRASE